ncbi:MAG: O-antigen ligase family protein [Nitrospiraceae bacterium]|nr:O-antigen ligase family protein [Nitrospiraceae bacterium]
MAQQVPLVQTIVVGAMLAVWTCLDPIVSAALGLDWFPFMLSAGLAACGLVGVVVLRGMDGVWRHKELWAIGCTIFAAQFSGVALGKLDALEFAVLVLVVFWLVRAFVEVDRTVQVTPFFFPMMGILFLAIFHFIQRPPVTSYIAIGEKILMFLILVDLMRTRESITITARCIVWVGVFSAVVAIVQFVLFFFWGIVWTIGASEEKAHAMLKPTLLGMVVRAMAFFPNPAGLNTYLLFACALALSFVFLSQGLRWKLAYLSAVGLMAIAVVLTWSAGALICLGAMFVLALFVYRPALSIHISALFLLCGILVYLSGLHKMVLEIVKGFGGKTSGSIRVELLELAMASLERNPFVGMGLQNFGRFSGNLFPTGPWLFKYPVHNAFMQMATELGIVGGVTYVFMVALMSVRLAIVLWGRLDQELKLIFKGMLLGWVALLGHLQTEPMAYESTFWVIMGVMEGAIIIVFKQRREETASIPAASVLASA